MKISIVVPVYNVPVDLLKPCLDSLAKQTLRSHEYEIVLVDDCSTDEATIQTVDEFAEETPNARVVRHLANLGLNEARRSGVKNAEGDYVIFIDGDDPIARDGIENLRIEASKNDADLVTAPMIRWNSVTKTYVSVAISRAPLENDYIERLRKILSGKHSFTMCGRLFKKKLLGDDVFNVPLGQLHEDITTFVRIAFKVKKVSHSNRPLYFYSLNPTSITNNFTKKHADGILASVRDWITNAKSLQIYDKLSEAMANGCEKLINVCVERCFYSSVLDDAGKCKVFSEIRDEYFSMPLPKVKPQFPGTRFLFDAPANDFKNDRTRLLDRASQYFPDIPPNQILHDAVLPHGMEPSEIAHRLKDKIVFVCQVDYQVRNAAAFARTLRLLGHPSVILDNSKVTAGGKRAFPDDERHIFYRTEHIRVSSTPYPVDWLSTAKFVVTFNDFNDDIREALEYRNRLGLPTACAVEGINDFLRVDFKGYRHLPYRRCDYVFLAGEHDSGYFTDRQTHVTGLPIIEALSEKQVAFPAEPLAVLNVNFTYGALEHERDGFVEKAKAAFEKAGIDWKITQHPMDKGELVDLPVSPKSQYQLIDDGTVFVSRFATGILEALASGKPAIYFNPHGEQVEKFKDPQGAFQIANSVDELAKALKSTIKDVEKGVDFRKRAEAFLMHHTGYNPDGPSIGTKFAEAVMEVIGSSQEAQYETPRLFFETAKRQELYDDLSGQNGVIFGEFDRHHNAQLNEEELIGRYFGNRLGLMIDVGANFGNSLDIYLGKGWKVHAFEPDPNNRAKLLDLWPDHPLLTVNSDAVSDQAGVKVDFFASSESTGISGLSAFTDGHKKIGEVLTTTLSEYYKLRGLDHVDFLKIDVEGFDKFVIDGFPWDVDKPEVVLAEFEDSKTIPLGYTTDDLARALIDRGYTVYISEWMPIVRYGISHDWRRMLRYSPNLELGETWGNVIGFLEDPGEKVIADLTMQTVKFGARTKLVSKVKPEASGATASAAPVSAPAGSEPTPIASVRRTSAQIRAARLAKLRRNPYQFFRDSHFFFLRPLRHLFTPGEAVNFGDKDRARARRDAKGLLSFLPVTRRTSARRMLHFERENERLAAASRADIKNLRREVESTEKFLRIEVSNQGTSVASAIASLSGNVDKVTSEKIDSAEAKLRLQIAELKEALSKSVDQLSRVEARWKRQFDKAVSEMNDAVSERIGNALEDITNRLSVAASEGSAALQTEVAQLQKLLGDRDVRVEAEKEALRTSISALSAQVAECQEVSACAQSSAKSLKSTTALQARSIDFLRERIISSERQIGALRHSDPPQTLVFLGHHKCASRLFRREIFQVVSETTGAYVHQYKIASPPFHYSRGEELDLCNMDFDAIGKHSRDVVMFSNATERSVERLDRATKDWRGIRIIRDPRQVLVSDYFHHKGDHLTEYGGWVYDQLKLDQPILRELPEEEGLLHELDHISKDIIETQILAPFDDERIMTIKLEDFAQDQEAWLIRISEFLKVADIAGVDLSRTFANPNSGPWQNHFTTRIRDTFKERYGQALIDLGYADDLDW